MSRRARMLKLVGSLAASLSALACLAAASPAAAPAVPFSGRAPALQGLFVLAGGAAYTNSAVVPGVSQLADVTGAVDMRFSTDGKVHWSEWTPYAATTMHTFSGAQDGTKTVDAEYRDANGTVLQLTDSLVFDPWAPAVSASGAVDAGWYNQPVVVVLSATDNAQGAGVAYVSYKFRGFTQTYPGSQAVLTVPTRPGGRVAAVYYASDLVGNRSARATLTFTMDSVRPTTAAEGAAGKAKEPLTLRYKAQDDRSPTVDVTIVIKDEYGATVTQVNVGTKTAAETWRTLKWTPPAKGTFTYSVRAVDLAGNQERKTGTARIEVKPVKKPKKE